ncbi:MAG: hypothetical protein R3A45_13295 [Bdellovibrionota bacterium]
MRFALLGIGISSQTDQNQEQSAAVSKRYSKLETSKPLLYGEKYTIAGAIKRLRELSKERNASKKQVKNQMSLLGNVRVCSIEKKR